MATIHTAIIMPFSPHHHHDNNLLLLLMLGRIFFMYKNDEGLTTMKNFPTRTISLVRRTPLMIASQVKTILLAQNNNKTF